ncbi:MAG: MTH938/NDUFAF3 family protein [Synergistetes bacterium]|nr:MTH938/NDUFAF3 family protein [Synergistota bacterium]MCX8128122.1 MTH938/NDUFAF3 family protein [Synergistota bacterium]MDW8192498.1 MTH938/NDUFAF3 family protein [Synergistota bacterium]
MTPPKIEKYKFGTIVIDGIEYKSDVVVTPEGVFSDWWRIEGHKLHFEDIEEFLSKSVIDVLIVGTGASGIMKVTEDLLKELKARGIEVIALPSQEACEIYNKLKDRKRVMGVFHLTC